MATVEAAGDGAQSDRSPVRPGTVLKGRYVVEELMAEGTMGSVWRGLDRDIDRPVAIKIPSEDCRKVEEFRERFAREVRRLIVFEHPHIVRIYDVGEHNGQPEHKMKFICAWCFQSGFAVGRIVFLDICANRSGNRAGGG